MGHAFAKIAQLVPSAVLEGSLVLFVAKGCTPTLNRLSVKPAMLACTAMKKVCRQLPSARSVQQGHTHPQLVSIVKTDATSVLLARGLIPLVRAADVKIALLTQPTLNPSVRPHEKPAPMASTPKKILVPRHVKHVQPVKNRSKPWGHDLAQNAKKVTSAVRE